MTTRLPLISAHELLTWLDAKALKSATIPVEDVQKRVRYMQVHGDAYREVFDCHQ